MFLPLTEAVRRQPRASQPDLCSAFCSIFIAVRGLSTSHAHHAGSIAKDTKPHLKPSKVTGPTATTTTEASITGSQPAKQANYIDITAERNATIQKRTEEALAAERDKAKRIPTMGGLAKGNIFEQGAISHRDTESTAHEASIVGVDPALYQRSPKNMDPRLNPNPNARARWTRMMVIRDIRRRGRLTKEMQIKRTERSHLSKSRFFETSVKKLAPLARQIAGKSLDEAILQMRFSSKKAAQEVRKHLIQARDEAIVIRGMGLPETAPDEIALGRRVVTANDEKTLIKQALSKNIPPTHVEQIHVPGSTQSSPISSGCEVVDPSNTPRLLTQRDSKALRKGITPNPTDMYIAEAWVNRGSYTKEGLPRARGRMDVMRHPHTGISVLLKEEKTRTREKYEKEIKAIRKRLNGKLWTQLPDRPIMRQSQYVLW